MHGRPKDAHERTLYFHARGVLDFNPPADGRDAFDEYISDPAKPVPYTLQMTTGYPRSYPSLDGEGAWSEFPVENWVVFSPAEQRDLLGKRDKVKAGDTWATPAELSQKLSHAFLPRHREQRCFEEQVSRPEAHRDRRERQRQRRWRASAPHRNFRMEHSFYHKADRKIAEKEP